MAEALKNKLADAGVTKLVLIRHANAVPPGGKKKGDYSQIHDWHRDDQLRALTDKGKKQAISSRKWFQESVTVKANKVLITSGARRASDTLQLLAEEKTATPGGMLSKVFGCSSADAVATQTAMDLVPSLHPAGIAPKCEEMFDTLGYGPLTKFYGKDGGKEAFDAYAEIVAKELSDIAGKVSRNPGDTLSCFGHAVFLNAVAVLVAERVWGASPDVIKQISEMDLGEAEGILLERKDDSMACRHMKA
mmetsp:Transcript_17718/g.31583  ORF Transcript_17718/g.31583 Transcript_17718/m.31583 type:complete len:248 (-) Transcript_17718:405-1148(-)